MSLDLKDNIIKNTRALICKQENNKVLFLLTKEDSGSITIPGGCKDLEDADLKVALQRELQEELGLYPDDYSLKDVGVQKEYDNLYNGNPDSERFGKKTIIYMYVISDLKKEPIPSAEIKGISWYTKEEALNSFNRPHMKELFELALETI